MLQLLYAFMKQISGITAWKTWGFKYFGARSTLKYFDQESRHFKVVGPHGVPLISEGVQILQHYSEVIGPGKVSDIVYGCLYCIDLHMTLQHIHFPCGQPNVIFYWS